MSFKAEAVRLCKVGDRSIREVAKDLDLTETALRAWVKRADIDAGKGPPGALTTAEREELTSFVFIAAKKALYPVRVLCALLEVSRSGYYAWVDRPAAPKTTSDAQLVLEIKAAMVRGRGAYGSPRVHRELRGSRHPREQEAHRTLDAPKRAGSATKATFRAHDRLLPRAPHRPERA